MNWLSNTKIDKNILKEEKFCLGYDGVELEVNEPSKNSNSFNKTREASLHFLHNGEKCDTNKVGLLYLEEMGYAGWEKSYLNNNLIFKLIDIFYLNHDYEGRVTDVITIFNPDKIGPQYVVPDVDWYWNRPVIILKSDVKLLSGDGTKTNAYQIN